MAGTSGLLCVLLAAAGNILMLLVDGGAWVGEGTSSSICPHNVWLWATLSSCPGIAWVDGRRYLSRAAGDGRRAAEDGCWVAAGPPLSSHCSLLPLPAVAKASCAHSCPPFLSACIQVQAAALQTRVVPAPNAAAGSLASTGLYKGVVPLQAAVMGLTFFAAVIGEALHAGLLGAHLGEALRGVRVWVRMSSCWRCI